MEKKLASWKGKQLSIGGRWTLVKASLSNLPIYYMSLYPLPKGVIGRLQSIQRKFLWSGSNDRHALPLVRWDVIELPKIIGGLGVGSLLNRNISLLFKWLWRYLSEPQSLLRSIIEPKYNYPSTFSILDLKVLKSGGPWRGLCASVLNNSPA